MSDRITVAMGHPLKPGTWLRLDRDEGVQRVVDCTGIGPYVVTLEPVRWWHQVVAWTRYQLGRPKRWRYDTRCLHEGTCCLRKAVRDCLCDKHWLQQVEAGEKPR